MSDLKIKNPPLQQTTSELLKITLVAYQAKTTLVLSKSTSKIAKISQLKIAWLLHNNEHVTKMHDFDWFKQMG